MGKIKLKEIQTEIPNSVLRPDGKGGTYWDNYNFKIPYLGKTNGLFQLAIGEKDKFCYSWGDNSNGQLGNNKTGAINNVSFPVSVSGNHEFVFITGGNLHSLGVDKNKESWGWGYNFYGQLGTNNTAYQSVPTLISGNHKFIKLTGGIYHSVSLDNSGRIWSCGINVSGELGNNQNGLGLNSSNFIEVCGNHICNDIKSGTWGNSLALDTSGTAWAWGRNDNGQAGNNTININHSIPVSVSGNHSFIKVDTGEFHSVGLKENGEIWAWGKNYPYGTLGINSNDVLNQHILVPSIVVGGHSFIDISIGNDINIALKENGEIWSWGRNDLGQLGLNNTFSQSIPTLILGDSNYIEISTTQHSSYARKNNGEIWSWGYNIKGQLGLNHTNNVSKPTLVQKLFK